MKLSKKGFFDVSTNNLIEQLFKIILFKIREVS